MKDYEALMLGMSYEELLWLGDDELLEFNDENEVVNASN